MIISISSPRFDPAASIILDVDEFKIGTERIHKTSAALAGSIELQDAGIRIQSTLSIIVKHATEPLYSKLQYVVSNHPVMNISHPNGYFQIAPSSATLSKNTIILNALVVGRV